MCFLSSYVSVFALFFICILLFVLYWFHKNNFKYWKTRGVPYLKPHWFFGNIGDVILKPSNWAKDCCKYYYTFKENGFGGLFLFRKPVLLICDADLIERVLIQDFNYFEDRVRPRPEESLANSLFFATGEKWRNMRFRLFPNFTSQKVRGMLDQILKCCDNILGQIDGSAKKKESVNVENLMYFFSSEVISSCTFGVQMMADVSQGKSYSKLLQTLIGSNVIFIAKFFIAESFPWMSSTLGIKFINNCIRDHFLGTTKTIIQYRHQNNINRHDIIQMILDLKDENIIERETCYVYPNRAAFNETKCNSKPHSPGFQKLSDGNMFTEECIASIMFNFLTAGATPTHATACFALFEIAKSPTIQKRLLEEVDSLILKHKQLTFEAINDMTYLDQVIQETLRLYNINPSLIRTATKPYRIPGTNLILEKGTYVYIPIAAIHLDPQYYPHPEQFNPDRFEGHNYKPTPFFMPFGYGPRIWICIRFAVIMMKVCIAKIIAGYTVNISKEIKLPMNFDRNCFYLKAEGGIMLTFEKRLT